MVPTAEVAAPVALTAEAEVAEVAAAAPEAEAEVEAEASADKEKECVKLIGTLFFCRYVLMIKQKEFIQCVVLVSCRYFRRE